MLGKKSSLIFLWLRYLFQLIKDAKPPQLTHIHTHKYKKYGKHKYWFTHTLQVAKILKTKVSKRERGIKKRLAIVHTQTVE